MDDSLYVCGGFDGVSSLDTVERFDSTCGRWQFAASMTKHRSAAGVVALSNGQIYALGGHNGLSIFESVERFDIARGRWEVGGLLGLNCMIVNSEL